MTPPVAMGKTIAPAGEMALAAARCSVGADR
jgi:hypothetical protein